jgi:hypothetical protein
MVSVERYSSLDIAEIFISKIEDIYARRRDVPGSKVNWPVLPNKKFSARSTKMVEEN